MVNRRHIAVLGLYRSGSTAVAGVLHHLGVDMGHPFFGGYYESAWLSEQLRRWWDEPRLVERTPQAERVRVLARWIAQREQAGAVWVGMKHPLLSHCGEDLLQAWGEDTRFIRCCRPLEDSIQSLKDLGGNCDSEFLQTALHTALDHFLANRPHLQVHFADMMKNPGGQIQRLIEYLGITPEPERLASAIQFVQPGKRAKVETEKREAKRGLKRLTGRLRNALRP